MKKFILLCVVALLAATSCKSDKEKVLETIAVGIEQMDRQLPLSFALGTMVDARLDGSQVVITANLNETYSTMLESLDIVDPEMGAIGFVKPLYETGQFSYEDFKVAELSIKCRYCDASGKLLREVVMSNADVLDAYLKVQSARNGQPMFGKQYYIDKVVRETEPALPCDFGNGVIFTDVKATENGVVMGYELSDELSRFMDFTPEVVQEQRDAVFQELKLICASDNFMFNDMAEHGIVYRYEYRNKSGKVLSSFDIPIAELVR